MVFLDIYTPILGQSISIDELFMKLKTKLKQEVIFQKDILQLQGTLDMLFALSSKTDPSYHEMTS
jgi:U3 small nucleolar RNA-associated protein 15